MFHLLMSLFVATLFFVLTPGILITLPPNGNKYTVAAFHGVVFALVYYLTHKAVWHLFYGRKRHDNSIIMKRM